MKILTTLLFLILTGTGAAAQSAAAPSEPLVIGVFERPPYASHTNDGAWLGLAVDL